MDGGTISVTFGSKAQTVCTDTLYQYDSGLSISFDDLEIDDGVEAHFAKLGAKDGAIAVEITDNTVAIPASMFETAAPFRCWVFVREDDYNATKYTITFANIESRPKPPDYVYSDLETSTTTFSSLEKSIGELQESIASITETVEALSDSVANGEAGSELAETVSTLSESLTTLSETVETISTAVLQTGGDKGDVLIKSSSEDYDAEFGELSMLTETYSDELTSTITLTDGEAVLTSFAGDDDFTVTTAAAEYAFDESDSRVTATQNDEDTTTISLWDDDERGKTLAVWHEVNEFYGTDYLTMTSDDIESYINNYGSLPDYYEETIGTNYVTIDPSELKTISADNDGSFTITFWVRISPFTYCDKSALLAIRSEDGEMIYVGADGSLYYNWVGYAQWINHRITTWDWEWHHFAVIFSESEIALYIDGERADGVESPGTYDSALNVITNAEAIYLGRGYEDYTGYYVTRDIDSARFDDLQVFGGVLSSDEIKNMAANYGKPRTLATEGYVDKTANQVYDAIDDVVDTLMDVVEALIYEDEEIISYLEMLLEYYNASQDVDASDSEV